MAKPLVSVDAIYEAALNLLDEGGPSALSARNLARALQCSTRTLYQQVGKREALIRQLLDHYFTNLKLQFKQAASWQSSTQAWANAMRSALLAHPNLTRLMTIENRGAITDYVNQLLKVLLHAGFSEQLALRSCRVLTHIVINLSLSEIEAPPIETRRKRRSQKEIQFEDLVIAQSGSTRREKHLQDIPEVFSTTVRWVIRGIEDDWEQSASK
jgi:AcrR family transcriptional regulator